MYEERQIVKFRSRTLKRFVAAFCCSVLFSCQATSARQASGFAQDLSGKPLDPQRSSSGKIVVMIFLRTDCPIANRYAPLLTQWSNEFGDRAKFWLVYPDAAESAELIRKHNQEFRLQFAVVRDIHHSLVKRARVTVTPEAAVFNAAGALVYHGRIDDSYSDAGHSRPKPTTHELEDAIRETLAGRAPLKNYVPAVGCFISDVP